MKPNKNDPVVDFGPEPFSPDGAAVLEALKFGAEVFSRDRITAIAGGFESQWGKARAASALLEVIERVESITGTTSHGSDPSLSREDSTLPSTEGDKQFRRALRKGQVVAVVSRRPLEDGRIRIVVTHEKLLAIKAGFIKAKTKSQGRSARMTCGILLVYSTNKFPTEMKRTFKDEGDLSDWFSGLEAKEEEPMMAADKTIDLRAWRIDARRGTRCEVHIMTSVGQKIERGKVLEPAKKGARIQLNDDELVWRRWNEVFPEGWLELHPEPAKPKTLGKLGDVIDLHKAAQEPKPPKVSLPGQPGKATFTVVPEAKPAPAPVMPVPVRSAPAVPDPGAARFSRRKERLDRKQMRRPKEHHLTAIGHIFRAERLKRAMHQRDVAIQLGSARDARDVCDIELGDVVPDDDTLIQFSEAFGVDLDLLLSARDGKQDTAADPVSAMKQIATLKAEASAANERQRELSIQLAQERSAHIETKAGLRAAEELLEELREQLDKATMPWDAQALRAVNEFIGKVASIQPIPNDSSKRHSWYEAALKMFEASK